MQLTQKQESLISQHLRDASRRLDANLPDNVRERSLRQLQARIYKEIEGLRTNAVSDDDIMGILARSNTIDVRKPSDEKAKVATKAATPPAEESFKPIWLGVCAHNADRFGLEPWMLRLAAVLLGVVTGPLALICYVGGYCEYYMGLSQEQRPKLAMGTLVLRAIVPFISLIVLRWGAGKIEEFIAWGHNKLLQVPLPAVGGDWDWLKYYEPTYFYLACLAVIPLGILSGLPLANAWGHSLKRLAQAVVALYGVMLCFGIASIIVGVILQHVETYQR